ncbi:MAG: DUF448 domain-containing protein [Myxococcales bacterium]|nr:DUF448 domain-containing protein [Myxococcales bacterium]
MTSKDNHKPPSSGLRTCVGCRGQEEPRALVRIVLGLDGELVVDIRQKLPGRGAYVHPRAECVTLALKREAFRRALKGAHRPATVEELTARMQEGLTRRLLERLGLARRAGAVEIGIEGARRAMREGTARFVLVGSDASEANRRQLVENCGRKGLQTGESLTGEQLASAVGEDFMTAIAVTKEPFAGDLMTLERTLEALTRAS